MKSVDLARSELEALASVVLATAESVSPEISDLAELVVERLRAGAKLLFCGNGGSAADAQHLAAEYVVRFRSDRGALPAIALTTDTSVLTAAANDDGFETVFARQVTALGNPGDVLFLHSTSGESSNLLLAAEAARRVGVTTVGMLAAGGGRLAGIVDRSVVIPTDDTARAQEVQLAVGHVLCELVERSLGGDPAR